MGGHGERSHLTGGSQLIDGEKGLKRIAPPGKTLLRPLQTIHDGEDLRHRALCGFDLFNGMLEGSSCGHGIITHGDLHARLEWPFEQLLRAVTLRLLTDDKSN